MSPLTANKVDEASYLILPVSIPFQVVLSGVQRHEGGQHTFSHGVGRGARLTSDRSAQEVGQHGFHRSERRVPHNRVQYGGWVADNLSFSLAKIGVHVHQQSGEIEVGSLHRIDDHWRYVTGAYDVFQDRDVVGSQIKSDTVRPQHTDGTGADVGSPRGSDLKIRFVVKQGDGKLNRLPVTGVGRERTEIANKRKSSAGGGRANADNDIAIIDIFNNLTHL